MTSVLEKNQIHLGVAGAFLILLFPFLPLTVRADAAFNVSLFGSIEQYGTLLLAPLAVFCVNRRALW